MSENKKGYYKQYYKKNKKRLIKQNCLYAKNNKKKVNKWHREWVTRNKDKVNEQRRKINIKKMPFTCNSIITTIRILEKLKLETNINQSNVNQIISKLQKIQLTAKKRKTWTQL